MLCTVLSVPPLAPTPLAVVVDSEMREGGPLGGDLVRLLHCRKPQCGPREVPSPV